MTDTTDDRNDDRTHHRYRVRTGRRNWPRDRRWSPRCCLQRPRLEAAVARERRTRRGARRPQRLLRRRARAWSRSNAASPPRNRDARRCHPDGVRGQSGRARGVGASVRSRAADPAKPVARRCGHRLGRCDGTGDGPNDGRIRDMDGYQSLSPDVRQALEADAWRFPADLPLSALETRLETRLRTEYELAAVAVSIDGCGRATVAAAPESGDTATAVPDGWRAVSISALLPTGLRSGDDVAVHVRGESMTATVLSASRRDQSGHGQSWPVALGRSPSIGASHRFRSRVQRGRDNREREPSSSWGRRTRSRVRPPKRSVARVALPSPFRPPTPTRYSLLIAPESPSPPVDWTPTARLCPGSSERITRFVAYRSVR